MLTFLALLILAVAVGSASAVIVVELRRNREEATTAALLAMFATAASEAQEDPRRLLAWQPAVAMARRLFGDAMKRLDDATGRPFPFGDSAVREAHARWTTSWLAWERAHDEEYKLKSAAAEASIARGDANARAQLAAVEREKLERYQQRYEEYVRVGKALAARFSEETGSRK